jgi:asparagine N-glycosylation enzyme membrane subunit Stt3
MNVTTVRSTAVAAGLAIAVTLAAGCSQTKEATKGAVSSASSVGSSAASSAASAAETAASSATGAPASATTLYYPTQAESVFSVDAPANWEVTQIEQFGDFTDLRSENGSVLAFRAQNFDTEEETKTEVESIVEGTFEHLKETFTDITLGDATEVTYGGKPGFEITGTGKDEDGNAVKFLSTTIVLGPKSIAEIWAAVEPEGPDLAEANAVIDSFKPTSGLR